MVNHGTWPHGIEWLHEAAAETYLPLLRVLAHLERDGVPANFNINLSPVLLEQLAHPHFIAEFPKYLERKIIAAREDEAYFLQIGRCAPDRDRAYVGTHFLRCAGGFRALHGDIVAGFRHFADAGMIEILTVRATHGYMPLLGTDESVRAQVRLASPDHERHIGKRPRGIWLPECGYRPAGFWQYPVNALRGCRTVRLRAHRHRAGARRVGPRLLLRRHAPGGGSRRASLALWPAGEPRAARLPSWSA